jgi:hypothetical protein
MAKVHFVSAHFGGPTPWTQQISSWHHDVSAAYYNDANTPSRHLAMHPRLKSKIHKMLEWRFVEADWYVWMDSSIRLTAADPAALILEAAGDAPLCLFRATTRQSIAEECAVVRSSLRMNHDYVAKRYSGEPILEQLVHYYGDPGFTDNKLFGMTFFAYHRSAAPLMLEWFMENLVWTVQDQVSFPYVLQRSGLSYALFEGTIDGSNPLFHWDWKAREANLGAPALR